MIRAENCEESSVSPFRETSIERRKMVERAFTSAKELMRSSYCCWRIHYFPLSTLINIIYSLLRTCFLITRVIFTINLSSSSASLSSLLSFSINFTLSFFNLLLRTKAFWNLEPLLYPVTPHHKPLPPSPSPLPLPSSPPPPVTLISLLIFHPHLLLNIIKKYTPLQSPPATLMTGSPE